MELLKKALERLPAAHRQFIAFCAVGTVGFLIDTSALSLLKRVVGLDPITARFISAFVIAMTASWYLNRSLTFRGRKSQSLWQEYLRFAMVNSIGNLSNVGVYSLLVESVAFFHRIPEAAVVIGTAVGLGFNFTGSKYLVFRRANPIADT